MITGKRFIVLLILIRKKNIKPPAGFTSVKHKKRAKKLEFEHVVAAQSFGQTFPEWLDGHEACVSRKGKLDFLAFTRQF